MSATILSTKLVLAVIVTSLVVGLYVISLGGYKDRDGWIHDWTGEVYRSDELGIDVSNTTDPTSTIRSLAATYHLTILHAVGPGFYSVGTSTHSRRELQSLFHGISNTNGVSAVIFAYRLNLE